MQVLQVLQVKKGIERATISCLLAVLMLYYTFYLLLLNRHRDGHKKRKETAREMRLRGGERKRERERGWERARERTREG